jgi:hypothetical protein
VILVLVTFVAPQAEAKKRECTGAEMALLFNLKEMSYSIEVVLQDENNQIDLLTSRYSDFAITQSTSSPSAVSLKNQINALKSKVLGRNKQIDSLDKQSRAVLGKCTTTTVAQLQSSKARKVCTSNEKKAINSVIASFRSVQDNKRLWDGKKRVAEAWMSDSTRPRAIQANARVDFNTYSRYYEIEETKESFVTSQFEFLNAGCRNSGLYLPRAYTPFPAPSPKPYPVMGPFLVDARYQATSWDGPALGGFISEQRSDGTVQIQCKDGGVPSVKFNYHTGIELEGAKLFLAGSTQVQSPGSADDFARAVFRVRKENVVAQMETFGPILGEGRLDGPYAIDATFTLYPPPFEGYAPLELREIVGKSIAFLHSGSVCGLITEPITNLKQSFASDIRGAALFLVAKYSKSPGHLLVFPHNFVEVPPGNQLAILIANWTVN